VAEHAIRYILLVLLFLASSLAAAGCSSPKGTIAVVMADAAALPAELGSEPRRVTEAYRFAAANPDVVKQMPCYCGCNSMDHTSNYSCFWQAEGVVELHATGCGICVDIAQDTIQGLSQGRSLADIRAQIDQDYSRFGPSTDTPPVTVKP